MFALNCNPLTQFSQNHKCKPRGDAIEEKPNKAEEQLMSLPNCVPMHSMVVRIF